MTETHCTCSCLAHIKCTATCSPGVIPSHVVCHDIHHFHASKSLVWGWQGVWLRTVEPLVAGHSSAES